MRRFLKRLAKKTGLWRDKGRVSEIRERYLNPGRTHHADPAAEVSPGVIIEQPQNVYIGRNVKLRPGVVLRPEGGFIHIGDNVVINHYTVIHAKGGVEIGDWSIMGPHCCIFAQNHSFEAFDMPITRQPNNGVGVTLMGDNWLGGGAIILDGVTLGKGAVVGAGAVVTKTFPMAAVVAGNPARMLKSRRREGTWDFCTEERCSVELTPGEYWPYINKRLEFARGLVSDGDAVLDVGCGEGYVTKGLVGSCRKITGIDYCLPAIEAASDGGPAEFLAMPSTSLAFGPGVFDKVLCFELLEHLTVLQGIRTLSEIHRVLKPGGMLVGSTPLRSTPESAPATYAHIYEYNHEELALMLEGFEKVSIDGGFFKAVKGGPRT